MNHSLIRHIEKEPKKENVSKQFSIPNKQEKSSNKIIDTNDESRLNSVGYYSLSDAFGSLNTERLIISVIMTISYLVTLIHYKPLPINHIWLFSDPIIIAFALFFIDYFMANDKKILSFTLFITMTFYNFSQVIYLALLCNISNIWLALALSFGIPLCMIVLFTAELIMGGI